MTTQAESLTLKPLIRRFKDLPLDKIPDRRSSRGWHRHAFKAFVSALLLGMLTARRSLRQLETLTHHLHPDIRKLTGINKGISDTKLRDCQESLTAEETRLLIHQQIKTEHRRGTLQPVNNIPFGIAALDGKGLGILDNWGHENIQKVAPDKKTPYGKALVHRTTLVSAAAPVCIDQRPVPGDTNEIGACPETLKQLLDVYGKTSLFEMIAADAGNASAAIATQIDDAHFAYLLRLKANHGGIYVDAVAAVKENAPIHVWRSFTGPKDARVTHVFRFYKMHPNDGRAYGWAHLRQWVCLTHEALDTSGEQLFFKHRIWASNLSWNRLNTSQWLTILRRYWRCENNNHWTADVFFKEDARRQPWTKDPETLFMLANLRMLALNIIAIRRAMSRAAGSQNTLLGWKEVLELALVWALTGIEYQKPQALLV